MYYYKNIFVLLLIACYIPIDVLSSEHKIINSRTDFALPGVYSLVRFEIQQLIFYNKSRIGGVFVS